MAARRPGDERVQLFSPQRAVRAPLANRPKPATGKGGSPAPNWGLASAAVPRLRALDRHHDDHTPSPAVGIVVLNWNRPRETARCLRSLDGLDYEGHEILVVDNGSTDDSVVSLRSSFPNLTIL